MINVAVDYGPMREFLDINEAIVKYMEKPQTMDKWTWAMGLSTSTAFNEYADIMSVMNPTQLGHMYEWGELGDPEGRLWNMILAPISSGKYVLDYNFKAAVAPNPQGEELTGIPGDTRQSDSHVFQWKAAVMELGIPVTISPKYSPILAIPTHETVNYNAGEMTPTTGGGNPYGGAGEMRFTPNTITPGVNMDAKGSFNELWTQFFTTTAIQLVNEEGIKPLEKFFTYDMRSRLYNKISRGKAVPKGSQISVNIKPRKLLGAEADNQIKRAIARIAAQALARRTYMKANYG